MNQEKNSHISSIMHVILVSSFLIRLILVFSGGQYYLFDEFRYSEALTAAEALWGGDMFKGLLILHRASHFLFRVIGILPATLQIIFGSSPKIPALFFSLFSVASLWLIWKITLRIGENERVALLSLSLLALCTTNLYYSRHLLPYDMSMAFGLLAIYTGLHKPSRDVDSILCGLFSACCFLVYNGYWTLGGFAMLVHILQPPHTFAKTVRRVVLSATFLALPIVIPILVSAVLDLGLLAQYINFSKTVNQGTFSEGWMIPFAYFWHAEHLLAILWLVALLFGLWSLAAGSKNESMVFAVSGIIFIYGTLVIFSVFLEKFVVYGRLARQMVPFCSILTALFLDKLLTSTPPIKSMVKVILLLVVCQAGLNFYQPFTQMFPKDFLRLASEISQQPFSPTLTELSSSDSVTIETEKYKVLYAHNFSSGPQPPTYTGKVILYRRNPIQFLPFLYEGFTRERRSKFRSIDTGMRLILKKKT